MIYEHLNQSQRYLDSNAIAVSKLLAPHNSACFLVGCLSHACTHWNSHFLRLPSSAILSATFLKLPDKMFHNYLNQT